MTKPAKATRAKTAEHVTQTILLPRGQKVILDSDLAYLYGVEIRTLNQAVKRNLDRFPKDFMFQNSTEEVKYLRSQTVIPKDLSRSEVLRSQSVILKSGSGSHRKYCPYAFTEQGVAMLSSVLRSKRAVLVNVEIMRAFVRLRQLMASNADLARKLSALERKYDAQFRVVFDAIRELMTPPEPGKKRPIGFAPWSEK